MVMVAAEPRIRPLGPRDAGMPMTLDEFDEAEFREGFRYELIQRVISEGESYATPLLPGFVLELTRMLAVSDKYKWR